jgi:hypothetical protein
MMTNSRLHGDVVRYTGLHKNKGSDSPAGLMIFASGAFVNPCVGWEQCEEGVQSRARWPKFYTGCSTRCQAHL